MSRIVFLGDSITHNFIKLNSISDSINLAVGGNKTTETISLVKETRMFKPDKVFLLIGVNDVLCNLRFYENGYTIPLYKSYDLLIDLLRTNLPKAKIYLLSTLPITTRTNYLSEEFVLKANDAIIDFNKTIKKISAIYDCTYIDLYQDFLDNNLMLSREYTIDGIHLSEKGYQVFYDQIEKLLI